MKGKGKEAPALTIEDSSDDDMTSSGKAGPSHVGNPKSATGGEGSSSNKRRVTAIQDSEDEEDDSKRIKKRKEDDHPDPEVKRLQALVTACGIRKSWKKEFAQRKLPTSEEQADYLRTVLREVGLAEEDESLEAAKALGRKRLLKKEAAELQPSKRIDDDGTNGNGTGRPARKSKTAASKRTKQELERSEGQQNRQTEALSSDNYDDDSGDEKRELKKVDKRAARNTDFFLAALGLAPHPARKPKKKRRDS